MKFTINIKDNKVPFFTELLKNLDFVDIEDSDLQEENRISPEIKGLLEERLEAYEKAKNQSIAWDSMKKEILP